MLFLTPRYLKQAKLLHKGVTRFLDYKRDVLPPSKVEEIEGLRSQLTAAMKAKDEKAIDSLNEKINDLCQRALPNLKNSDIADNIEVFFVAIVVALGIRSYIAQPFQIPTGSMQPTLNGIVATPSETDPTPSFLETALGFVTGKSYVNVVSDREGYLDPKAPITESSFTLSLFPPRFWFLSPHTMLNFADGSSIAIKGPKDKVLSDLGLGRNLTLPGQTYGESQTPDRRPLTIYDDGNMGRAIHISKGQLLARGIVNWGDHVLVNKFAYHFRQPTRGEVFVFTTRNISGINVPAEQGAQFYIKRLVGTPNDELEVKAPELWVNGKPAEEFGIKRVGAAKEPYKGYGALRGLSPGYTVKLEPDQYWAMGDNSFNSSDSRYWGPVPQRNVVGPGSFCYFPFTLHWGPIW